MARHTIHCPILGLGVAMVAALSGCGKKETHYSFDFDYLRKDDHVVVIFNGTHAPPIDHLQDALRALNFTPVKTPTLPVLTAKGDLRVGEYNHGRCWQNYERGPLRVVGKLDTDANYEHYDAIWKIYFYDEGTPALCGHEKLAELVPDYPYAD